MHRMAVMKNICILICCFLIGAVAWGDETNPVFTTSYFIDRSNQQSIQSIESQNFSLYKNDLRLGYTDNPIWIKIDTAPLFGNLTTQANPTEVANWALLHRSDRKVRVDQSRMANSSQGRLGQREQ